MPDEEFPVETVEVFVDEEETDGEEERDSEEVGEAGFDLLDDEWEVWFGSLYSGS